MPTDNKELRARSTYAALLSYFSAKNLKYMQNDDRMTVEISLPAKKMSFNFKITVSPSKETISFVTELPVRPQEELRRDVAIGIVSLNFRIHHGSFRFDINDGQTLFQLVNSFEGDGTVLTDKCMEDLMLKALLTADRYSQEITKLQLGAMSLTEFLEMLNK